MNSDINMKNIAPTLKGDTIILRKPKESDIDDRVEIGRSKEFVHMCGGDTRDFKPFTRKDMEGWYKQVCSHEYEWIIEFSGKCIGGIRLTINEPDNNARLAIGIYDDTLYGQGIGTEATRLVLEYAFNTLKLHRIDLKVLEYNKRAISCYKKCGFKIEGTLRESAYIEDKWESDLIMSILECEYNNSRLELDKTLYSQMYEKELSHLKQESRNSNEYMETLLADDFIEFQSSGGIINKHQALDALKTESDITFELTDFRSKPLSDTVVLNTYQIIKVSGKGEKLSRSLRSSIWKYEDGRWQFVFHQGTLTSL